MAVDYYPPPPNPRLTDRRADKSNVEPWGIPIELRLPRVYEGGGGSVDGILIGGGGGVKSEQRNELIMVMPEQIDERDVRLSPRSSGGSWIPQQDLDSLDSRRPSQSNQSRGASCGVQLPAAATGD